MSSTPVGPGITAPSGTSLVLDTSTRLRSLSSTDASGETVVVTVTNSFTTTATPNPSKKNSVGVIAGVSLGGLTFIVLLVVAIIFYRRRRHRARPSPTPLIHDPNYTQPPRKNEKLAQVLREKDEARRRRAHLQTAVEERNGDRERRMQLQIERLSERILELEAQQRELDDAPPGYSS